MKKPIPLILFFCLSASLLSQEHKQRLSEEFIQFDTTVFFPELGVDVYRLPLCFFNDSIFFTRDDIRIRHDSCNLYMVDANTKIVNKAHISFEGIKPLLHEHPALPGVKDAELIDIAINGRYLILLLNDYLFTYLTVFDRFPDNRFVFKEKLVSFDKEEVGVSKIHFLSTGKLLLYRNYWDVDSPPEKTPAFHIFNIEKWQVEKELFPGCSHPVFTYFNPSQVMALTDSSIFYAQMGQYRITEYDFDFNPIHTLENPEVEWEELPKEKMDSLLYGLEEPIDKIYAIVPFLDLYSRLRYVFPVDQGLLVFYNKKGNQFDFYFDIWKKENGAWILAEQEGSDCKAYPKIDFMQSRIITGVNPLYWGNDYFFRMLDRPPFDQDKRFRTDEEYKQACDEYYLENDDVFAIDFFKYSFSD